jgi:L-asparagine transporter-like permease
MSLEIKGENLHRGLNERHIQLIAIGGAIGVGLFYDSAGAIKAAGPLLILCYLVGGIIMFFMMRALGELALAHPVSGSFSAYANHFINPFFGYLTGSEPIRLVPWARGYSIALSKPNVVLFATLRTEQRKGLFQWVGLLSSPFETGF